MIRLLTVPTLLGAMTLSALALVPASAQAEHRDFCYHGRHYGFAGEAEIIDALEHIDAAYASSSRRARRQEALTAAHMISQAHAQIVSPFSRRELADAYDHMSEFLSYEGDRDLETAAVHLQSALELARPRTVVRRPSLPPVVAPYPRLPPAPLPPAPFPPYVGHGHHAPPIVHHAPHHVPHSAPHYRSSGVSFGNDRFRINIGF